MRRLLAIAGQTVLSAVRFRVVVAAAVLLGVAVVILPLLVKHNDTARMYAQVMLTYNLIVGLGLLGFITLWLACGTLSGEIESGELQLVSTKPIRPWQLWLGKWLGLVGINVLLLGLSLAVTLGMLYGRSDELPEHQRAALHEQVLLARGHVVESATDLERDIEALVSHRLAQPDATDLDPEFVREQMTTMARARHEALAPNYRRQWALDFRGSGVGSQQKLHARVRFHAAGRDGGKTHDTVWVFGDPRTGQATRVPRALTTGTAHEFEIPAGHIGADGWLHVECENRGDTTLLFPLNSGLVVLYPAGGFAANVFRSAVILLCWLMLLAALGLAASSFLSFPTAAMASLGLLYIALSGGSIRETVQDDSVFGYTEETHEKVSEGLDQIFMPVFQGLDFVVNGITRYSPITDLGAGRLIEWAVMWDAVIRVVVLAGGLCACVGIISLSRRQLGLPMSS